jgi:hypothetical protein
MRTLKIKLCKYCGCNDEENRFLNNRNNACIKCLSCQSNKALNKHNYFDEYYQLNKDKVLAQQRENYRLKKEKKILDINSLVI